MYYPSADGVAIPSNVFFKLVKDDKVQQTMDYWIEDDTYTIEEEFKFHVVCTSPEKTVTFTKEMAGRRGFKHETSKTLSRDQWIQFIHVKDSISINIVSLLFENVDLVSRFMTLSPTSFMESDKLYNDQLLNYFRPALIKAFFNCGVLEFSEETENTIGTFNEACLKLNVLNVVQEFFFQISSVILPCGRKLSSCVTDAFLDELDFVNLINDVRVEMCCLEQWL